MVTIGDWLHLISDNDIKFELYHFTKEEKDTEIIFKFNCAGLSDENMAIEIEGSDIVVKVSFPKNDNRYSYEDKFSVKNADLSKVTASLSKGMLEVKVPFKEKRKVDIKVD
jgi:HSP20 family molecular chaperone IbpA